VDFEHPKKDNEKKCRSEYVHPDGMKIARSLSFHVLCRQKPWLEHQIPQRTKELSIEMCEVIKEMSKQMPEAFSWFKILLSAVVTIVTDYLGAAVQTVPFFALGKMRQL
jgi:hypothetical protein